MFQGRPLYDNAADRALFVVPDEWNAIERALEQRNNVLVFGARGSGKTSLLRQLQDALRNQRGRVAFVDATAVGSALELITRVRRAAVGEPSVGERFREMTTATSELVAGSAPVTVDAPRMLLQELERLAAVHETTILVDASGSAQEAHALFGRMRDALWQMPHRWVVAVDADERFVALKPPADVFFDTVVHLGPRRIDELLSILSRRDQTQMLDAPSRLAIAVNANGSPRATLRIANDALVSDVRPFDSLSERARLLDAASEKGRPHGMLMAELLDLGQASPSDDVLQHRLGLTRGRITVLLRELLEAGLVVAATDKTHGPGRPRTIYRPSLESLR